jgi:hypothetical protein
MSFTRTILELPRSLVEKTISRKAFLVFARKHDFVFFGYVNQHTDEHELVRGVTLSSKHLDTNYCIGNFQGRDVTLLRRSDTVHFPGKPTETYSWTIMQFDLKKSTLPHIFIDANHHDEAFYANLFMKFTNFKNANGYFVGEQYDGLFNKSFKVYTPPDESGSMLRVLSAEVVSNMAHHFRQYDFEIFEDQLLIYSSDRIVTAKLLEHMLRAGLWMSEVCDSYQPPQEIVEND